MDHSPPGSSVHGILQARILEWVALPSSRGSSQPRDHTHPQVLKAGFVLGGSGGSGVLLVRDAKTGGWVGPAFYTMGSASLGFQAGAASAEMVMVINSQKAPNAIYTNKVKLGGDASVAVGPKGAGTGGSLTADFIVYAKAKGVFAGIAVDGSVLDVRQGLNAGRSEER